VIRRILSAYIAEAIKYSRLFGPWFGPAFVLLAVGAAIYVHPVSRDGASDFDFVGYAVPASLNLIGFLMVLVYSAGLVAGEVEHGTIRTVLVRPIQRGEFLAAKLLNAMSYALLLTLLATIAAWSLAASLGELTGVDFGGDLIYTSQEMNAALGAAVLLNIVPYLTGAAYAVMVSAIAGRSATAVTATVGGWLLMDYGKHALRIDRFIFSTYLDQGWTVFADRCRGIPTQFFPEAGIGLAVCAVWFAVFTTVAFVAIRRRNFGS
jgi:ABC-type transport system involved in multi-copper enzyme maturation permease subunit